MIAGLVVVVAGGAVAGVVLVPMLNGGTEAIPGTVSPTIARSDRLHPLAGDQSMTVSVVLRPKGGLQNLIATARAISDPASPQYGKYLSPTQVRARFAPSPDSARALADYLRGHGLSIVPTDPMGRTLTVSGSERALEGAFGVRLYQWRDRTTGRVYFANQTPVALPAALAAEVVTVFGLDTHTPLEPLAELAIGDPPGLTPAQLRRAYDVQPLIDSVGCGMPCLGYGQTVAVFALGGFDQKNIDTFDNQYGLPAPNIKVNSMVPYLTSGTSGTSGTVDGFSISDQALSPSQTGAETEAELDIEMVHAIAPGASIHAYELCVQGGAPGECAQLAQSNSDYASAFVAFLHAVESYQDPIATISFGGCEGAYQRSQLAALTGELATMAMQGQSVFVSSGDHGKNCTGGQAGIGSVEGVQYPASDPWVTAVGGTHLDLNADSSYKDEQAWDKSGTAASGGGVSSLFSKPDWQRGSSYTKRQVPDVAADADGGSALGVCAHGAGLLDCWGPLGGTSAAAPSWAGIAAIFDQYAKANGNFPLGFVNGLLYETALHDQAFPPLHDVTDSQGPFDLFAPAFPGWDFATGLGTPDAYDLIRDLNPTLQMFPSSGPSGTTVHLRASPFHTGDTVSFYLLPPTAPNGTLLCKGVAGANPAGGQHVAECSAVISTKAPQGTHLKLFVVDPNVPRQARGTFVVGSGSRGPTITEFAIPSSNSKPEGITAGPDGNLWFAENGAGVPPVGDGAAIAKITPNGAFAKYPLPATRAIFSPGSSRITAGPDGNLWFTEALTDSIGKITTNGSLTEYKLPTIQSFPSDITVGPDGNLWFTESATNYQSNFGKITPSGVITEYPEPANSCPPAAGICSVPYDITKGPDGNLWFTEGAAHEPGEIGKLTTTGSFTLYSVANCDGCEPRGITAGPDGNLWFVENRDNKIGKITTSGAISEYPVPTSGSNPSDITAGPDGNLWFTEQAANKLGMITSSGTITEYPLPTANSGPDVITTGPDGNLWFTELYGNKIGRVNM